MKMAMGVDRVVSVLSLVLLVAGAVSAELPSVSLPSLAPAFLWSNHKWLDSDAHYRSGYQTLSSEDLVEKVKNEFVRPTSKLGQEQEDVELDLDAGVVVQPGMDMVVAFIGTKLLSGDVAREGVPGTSDLLLVLDGVIAASNSSLSLPYVAPPRNGASLMDVLLTKIVGGVENGESRLGEVITAGACVHDNSPRIKRVSSLNALKQHLFGRMGTKSAGETDLVVVCSSLDVESLGPRPLSEGGILGEVLWGLEELKVRYVALYATDVSGAKTFHSRPRGRQLGSVVYEDQVFCDEICRFKAALLEGLVVGLTFLIILISGLCCLAEISSPSRFEQAKDGGQ